MSRPVFDRPKRGGLVGFGNYIQDNAWPSLTAVCIAMLVAGQASRLPATQRGSLLEITFVTVDLVCLAVAVVSRRWLAIVLSALWLVATLSGS